MTKKMTQKGGRRVRTVVDGKVKWIEQKSVKLPPVESQELENFGLKNNTRNDREGTMSKVYSGLTASKPESFGVKERINLYKSREALYNTNQYNLMTPEQKKEYNSLSTKDKRNMKIANGHNKFQKIFNIRSQKQRNENNENRFFGQTGRVISSDYNLLNNHYNTMNTTEAKAEGKTGFYEKNSEGKWQKKKPKRMSKKSLKGLRKDQEADRLAWEKQFLERSEDYLTYDNKQHKNRYEQLKLAKQRMNNNLTKTRAILEHTKAKSYENNSPGVNTHNVVTSNGKTSKTHSWSRSNRNSKFDPMFHMTRKQLKAIQNNPQNYLENSNNFINSSNFDTMKLEPYIGKFN